MKNLSVKTLSASLLFLLISVSGIMAQEESYTVVVDEVLNGSIKLEPAIPADGKVKEGTVIQVK